MEEVIQVLRMNGGMGDTSYANNSLVQRKVLALTKPIREQAVTNLYCKMLPERLVIADLGCSSGPNTFYVVSEVIKTVEKLCQGLNHESPEEYQVFLNDLPGNDFNNIFRSLGSFKDKLSHEIVPGIGPCFLSGVPGSFYGRLFPSKSLHFVHSSYSLQWLSQGIIREEEVESFNIPQYTTCASEVEEEVVKEGSFSINHEEVSAVDWNAYSNEWNKRDNEFSETEVASDYGAFNVTHCMRAVAEPLLISHFGDDIIEQVFKRYQEILTDHISKEKTQFINVTFSMTKT